MESEGDRGKVASRFTSGSTGKKKRFYILIKRETSRSPGGREGAREKSTGPKGRKRR